ncbi:MAG: tetratricopeptide repeat protein, partial [Bacteroidota bacterium]
MRRCLAAFNFNYTTTYPVLDHSLIRYWIILYLTFSVSNFSSAQVNRQLKKIEQHLSNYELVAGEKKMDKMARKLSVKHKKYNNFLLQKAKLAQLKGTPQAAIQAIDQAIARTPVHQQAALFALKGKAIFDLENYALADSLFRKAHHLQMQYDATNYALKAKILTDLGGVYIEQTNYPTADSLYTIAKKIVEQNQLKNFLLYPEILYRIAEAQYQQDDLSTAENTLKKSAAYLDKLVAPDHPEQAFIKIHQGLIFEKNGKHTAAETTFRQALDIRADTYGKNHPLYAKTLRNIARSLYHQGKYAKAETLLLEVKSAPFLSKTTASYAFTMNTLGIVYEEMGKHEAAIEA